MSGRKEVTNKIASYHDEERKANEEEDRRKKKGRKQSTGGRSDKNVAIDGTEEHALQCVVDHLHVSVF